MTTAVGTTSALIDGVDVDAVASAVQACPAVSGLYGGSGDAIASYLPGRRVTGVEVVDSIPTVYVRSRWGVPAAEVLRQIAVVLRPVIGFRHFEVVVADIDDPDVPGGPPAVARTTVAPVVVAPAGVAPAVVTPAGVTPAIVTPAVEPPAVEPPAVVAPTVVTPAVVTVASDEGRPPGSGSPPLPTAPTP